jgi:hypothetical protein
MPWTDQLRGDSPTWLLTHPEPAVRHAALRWLSGRPADDPELRQAALQAHRSGPIAEILARMAPEGWWGKPGGGYGSKYQSGVWSLISLGQMGADIRYDERIATACRYYLEHAFTSIGPISSNGAPSGTIDCLQGNMLTALIDLGVWDERFDNAIAWMARSVTGEGMAPNTDKKAKRRYYAYKCGPLFACGPNGKLPCAWGAVKVLLAFGRLPREKQTPLIQRAIEKGVEFLFSIDPLTAEYPIGMGTKPSRNWWKFGFPVFYITDLLQLAEALAGLGYANDPRLAGTLKFILEKQDGDGRWKLEYHYNGKTWVDVGRGGQPNPWVTLRGLKVLKAI